MTLDEAIFTALSSSSSVTAIAGDRSYPVQAQQGTDLPYDVWQTISAVQDNTHDKLAEVETVLVQFSCYGSTYTQAHDLRQALRLTLEGTVLGNGSSGTIEGRRETDESSDVQQLFRADIDVSFVSATGNTVPVVITPPPA